MSDTAVDLPLPGDAVVTEQPKRKRTGDHAGKNFKHNNLAGYMFISP